MNEIERLREIILDNNWFDTPAGERFREMYGICRNITGVMSFAGRSKDRCSYLLLDSDETYVTHLYTDDKGNVYMQLSTEDTDELDAIITPIYEPVDELPEEILNEWIELLDY